MNRVEELQQSGRGYSRTLRDFLIQFSKEPNNLYCFFEGQDDPKYYGRRIDEIVFPDTENKRRNLWCSGKGNLISLHKLIKDDLRFKEAWVAFFLDNDFDQQSELPQCDSVYITPCYSIENLYARPSTIKRILQDEFGLSFADPEFDNTFNIYLQRLHEFLDANVELNAWIYLQQKGAIQKKSGGKLNLQNVSPDKLFRIKISTVQKLYSLSKLTNLFPQSATIDQVLLNSKVKEFQGCNKGDVFRGKYLLHFVRIWLILLVKDSNKRHSREHFSIRRKVAMQLSENIISELSVYAETPTCLKKFLKILQQKTPMQVVMRFPGPEVPPST